MNRTPGTFHRGDGTYTEFYSIRGADVDEIAEMAEDHGTVTAKVIEEYDGEFVAKREVLETAFRPATTSGPRRLPGRNWPNSSTSVSRPSRSIPRRPSGSCSRCYWKR